MFTGLVQAICPIKEYESSNSIDRITIKWENHDLSGENLGDSIAIDGVCLTLANIDDQDLTFEIVAGTLQKTTFGNENPRRIVNVERSARVGDYNGGHDVSGHIDFVGYVRRRVDVGDSAFFSIEVPTSEILYFFNQGFVALNGASITVFNVDRSLDRFDVWLIPETLSRTNLSLLQEGSGVNIEVDPFARIVVDGINHAVAKNLVGSSDPDLGTIVNDISQLVMMKVVSERENMLNYRKNDE